MIMTLLFKRKVIIKSSLMDDEAHTIYGVSVPQKEGKEVYGRVRIMRIGNAIARR